MDFWTLYVNGLYEFIMFILTLILMIIVFLSYVLIVIGGIALLIVIPIGICVGVCELCKYCTNRSNIDIELHSDHSSDEVNIELPHVIQSMPVESSLQSVNRIQTTNYEQV